MGLNNYFQIEAELTSVKVLEENEDGRVYNIRVEQCHPDLVKRDRMPIPNYKKKHETYDFVGYGSGGSDDQLALLGEIDSKRHASKSKDKIVDERIVIRIEAEARTEGLVVVSVAPANGADFIKLVNALGLREIF